MYFTSQLINKANSDMNEIYIMNGQNISQIMQYQQLNNTHGWNPCIPMIFKNTKSITITFDSLNVNNYRDWYPFDICDYTENNIKYNNMYLFDGGSWLTINNLYIDQTYHYKH